MSVRPASRKPALYLAMLASGFAALGYEMVWTRMLAVALGHEIVAALAVVAAFFMGLSIGAFVLDGAIRRSAAPHRWYAALELAIAAWALASVVLVPWFNDAVARLIGTEPSAWAHWSGAFAGTFLLLLPATAAMGATLPAMERIQSVLRGQGRTVAGLYATNTLGAVAGTMAATFVLAPWLGFTWTLVVLAAINGLCALAVLAAAGAGRRAAAAPPATGVPGPTGLTVTLLLTGLIGIGYEVLVIRVLSQVLQNTVYTFASLLSVYLLGTALGAALYQRFAPRGRFETVLAGLLVLLSLACLAGVGLLGLIDEIAGALHAVLGDGFARAAGTELAVALVVFLVPTVFMGATFSHLAQAASHRYGLGRALAVNTLGGALAPLLFGVLLLPVLGSKAALLLACVAYLALIPPSAMKVQRRAVVPAAGAAAVAAVALLLAPLQLRFVSVPPDGELEAYRDGVMAAVAVVRDGQGARHLKVNNHFIMGGTATSFADRRQAHVPLLLHPEPRDALFLGLGTGATFVAAGEHPGLRATAVELIPELMPLLEYFGPGAEALRADERFRLVTGDARRYVRAAPERYDVIIAEVFHPSRDGAGSLYTVEHFRAIGERLREGGLFCQWLPLFQLDLPTLKTIMRTFLSVYPQGEAYLAHFSLAQPVLGLVTRDGPGYQPGWMGARLGDRRLASELQGMRLTSDFDLFGHFLGKGEALARFAGAGPLNTDDRPVVTFRAPDFLYAPAAPPWERLLNLVNALEAAPHELLAQRAPTGDDFAERLRDYWRARDAFLNAGVGVEPSPDVRVMLAQVRDPLLSVVRLSGDFAPAYQPLLVMANQLFQTDPQGAWRLLTALDDASPERHEAARLRRELFGR